MTNWAMASTIGYTLIGGDLVTFFFIVFLLLFAITSVRPFTRKVLWRVRNRLFVTYFLVGAVPIVLLAIIVMVGFYLLIGQTTGYMVQSELDQRLDRLHSSAVQAAQAVAYGRAAEGAGFAKHVLIRTGNRISSTPPNAPITEFPAWAKPGFNGVVRAASGGYFIAAHALARAAERVVEVFAYDPLDETLLSQLLPGLASIQVMGRDVNVNIHASPSGTKVRTTARGADVDLIPVLDSRKVIPLPQARGFWDVDVGWVAQLHVWPVDSDRSHQELMILTSRPSLIVSRLFSTLGTFAPVVGIILALLSGIFLFMEFGAIVASAQLTRSLTRTVHDLYTGTKTVESGDFSHRIPIRTKDQLSELATSFNHMTERIAQLIAEVKEKEKLEAELEIAREVQAQLFPKGVPKLKTLELAGVCNPARVVSGDYYDFVPLLNPDRTAIVIGDIAGKGISAALLMASIQSALHAQLGLSNSDGDMSTATLVARLNRQLYENTSPEKYATFYCAVYDDQSGQLAYTNAGHLPPILIRSGKASRLEVNGMVVGILPDFAYGQNIIELQRGDLLAAFTDGITESENEQAEQFGDERLTQLLIDNAEKPLEEIVQIVTRTVREWAYDLDNQDDTTMLLARRL